MRLAAAASTPPSRIRAIANLADRHPGTLRLFYGEDTLPTPDFIKRAAKDALDADRTFYTPNAGDADLKAAIVEHYGALHHVGINESEVVVTGSGMMAIQLAIAATVGPGDSALIVTPLWPNFHGAVRVAGAAPIEVPLTLGDDGFALDLDRIEAAIRPETRLIALASPGNPTGWTASPDDWCRLVDLCQRRDLWLLADGVYERIIFDPVVDAAPGPLEIPEARSRTIVAQSFSKAYRMTGWRIGFAVAPPELARTMAVLQEFAVSHAFGVSQAAALVAIRDGEPFLADARRRYTRHRDRAVTRLRAIPGVSVPVPTGAFYVFPRLEGLDDSMAFCERLVRERAVGLAPGSAFGEGGEGHVRICFAVDEATLDEALDRFEVGWIEHIQESQRH